MQARKFKDAGADFDHVSRQQFAIYRDREVHAMGLPAHWLKRMEDHHEAGRNAAYAAPNAEVQKVFEKFASRMMGLEWLDMPAKKRRQLADESANECKRVFLELDMGASQKQKIELVQALCHARGIEPPKLQATADKACRTFSISKQQDKDNAIKGAIARIQCAAWWRRALRTKVQRLSEGEKFRAGEVCKRSGQSYASNVAVKERIEQEKNSADMLANTFIKNEEGAVLTLLEVQQKTTAAKHIRRGELMTRVRGCEELAERGGHVGVFFTMTAPSRFHSVVWTGEKNDKYDQGCDPRDAQAWLFKAWTRTRAKLKNQKVDFYGVRVAEPHHDGCPHWHMLIWTKTKDDMRKVGQAINKQWKRPADMEAGAEKNRINTKAIRARRPDGRGGYKHGAASYLAKYISKNIDDHGIKNHTDDYGKTTIEPDLLGDLEIKPSQRVIAWAGTWGIRQFQTFGMPPVMVWRELRRCEKSDVEAHLNPDLAKVWHAVHKFTMRQGNEERGIKEENKLADWATYTELQGGVGAAGSSRNCRFRLARRGMGLRDGKYQAVLDDAPIGVIDTKRRQFVASKRKIWSAATLQDYKEGKAGKAAKRPRTCLNNCTTKPQGAWAQLSQNMPEWQYIEKLRHELSKGNRSP